MENKVMTTNQPLDEVYIADSDIFKVAQHAVNLAYEVIKDTSKPYEQLTDSDKEMQAYKIIQKYGDPAIWNDEALPADYRRAWYFDNYGIEPTPEEYTLGGL